VYRGWPLLVDVGVFHPQSWVTLDEGRVPTPLKVIPASGGWDSLVKVHFLGPGRAEVVLPLVPMFHPEGALVIDAERPSYMLRWHMSPEETRAMAPGEYVAFAELESSYGAEQGGWTGRVGSVAMYFEVVDEPVPFPPEQVERKALVFSQYEVYRGNPSAALAILEAHVAAQPDSPGALSAKAQLLESAGELERAFATYNEALSAFYRKHPDRRQEAPLDIVMGRRALRERLYPLSAQ
jgi:hypothetical protein